MRNFILLTQEGYHGVYKGGIYDENFIAGDVSVLELTKKYPEDWEEVFEEPIKPLHKDTDLGYFAFEFTKELIKIFAVTSPEVFEDIPNRAMYLAKELIKQLDAESK